MCVLEKKSPRRPVPSADHSHAVETLSRPREVVGNAGVCTFVLRNALRTRLPLILINEKKVEHGAPGKLTPERGVCGGNWLRLEDECA
jgi:hypothetical protein